MELAFLQFTAKKMGTHPPCHVSTASEEPLTDFSQWGLNPAHQLCLTGLGWVLSVARSSKFPRRFSWVVRAESWRDEFSSVLAFWDGGLTECSGVSQRIKLPWRLVGVFTSMRPLFSNCRPWTIGFGISQELIRKCII